MAPGVRGPGLRLHSRNRRAGAGRCRDTARRDGALALAAPSPLPVRRLAPCRPAPRPAFDHCFAEMIHTLQLHMRKKLFTVSTPPQVFQNRSKTDNGVHDD